MGGCFWRYHSVTFKQWGKALDINERSWFSFSSVLFPTLMFSSILPMFSFTCLSEREYRIYSDSGSNPNRTHWTYWSWCRNYIQDKLHTHFLLPSWDLRLQNQLRSKSCLSFLLDFFVLFINQRQSLLNVNIFQINVRKSQFKKISKMLKCTQYLWGHEQRIFRVKPTRVTAKDSGYQT